MQEERQRLVNYVERKKIKSVKFVETMKHLGRVGCGVREMCCVPLQLEVHCVSREVHFVTQEGHFVS